MAAVTPGKHNEDDDDDNDGNDDDEWLYFVDI